MAGLTLVRCLSSLVRRKVQARFKNEFMKKARNALWIMLMGVRSWRRKRAVVKIIDFLRSFKGNYRIKTVVHRFVESAHMIQRAGRDFISVNRERASIVATKFWDKLEVAYIVKRLEERKRLELNAVSANKSSMSIDLVPPKMRIELDKQADKWKAIDAKMEKDLQRHRLAGILPNADSLRDVALTMMLSADTKRKAIETYVMLRRKAFVILRDEIRVTRRREAENFSKQDAADLLKSRDTAKIDDTVQRKFRESMLTTIDNNPFLMYKSIDKKMLTTVIQKIHDAVGTFSIKVRAPRKTSSFGAGPGRKNAAPVPSSPAAVPLNMIHPSILAARQQKEAQEKKRVQQMLDFAIDDAVRSGLSGQLQERKFVLREDQKRRRGGVQLAGIV